MSDTEKDRPEGPKEGESDAKPSGGAVVISIEQARAELLAKPRQRATPQMGVARSRPRAREVPAPVTLPPGEHAAVIVTDTPAARAHVDKKTVHPGEMPAHTHEKKVRVKTSLDPRRAKTQISDRRGPEGAPDSMRPPPSQDEAEGSLWNRPSQPASQPPSATAPSSIPPRPSLVRPKPIQRERSSVPLFVLGVVLAAALGAGVVYLLGRSGSSGTTASTATTAAAPPATIAPPAVTASSATATATATTTATAEPTAPATATTAASVPSVVKSATAKPPTTTTAAPAATTKPTATSVLPFGVGHD